MLFSNQGTLQWRTHNFIRVKQIAVCQGSLPEQLLDAWDDWRTDPSHDCQNDRPDYFPSDQCFIVFAFEAGGYDLEHYAFHSWMQVRSMLSQVVVSMAAAEAVYRFEHRDLHVGNILIAKQQVVQGKSLFKLLMVLAAGT